MKIKLYNEFVFESEDSDFKIVSLMAALTRNYSSNKTFYTDLVQFTINEERRDWGDIRQKAVLEKTTTEKGFYKLDFVLDDKKYLLEINFKLSYIGKKERDVPETASDENLERLNTVLTDVTPERISLSSSSVNYATSNISDSVKKAVELFIVKMMEVDYDTLGEKIYSLEQK